MTRRPSHAADTDHVVKIEVAGAYGATAARKPALWMSWAKYALAICTSCDSLIRATVESALRAYTMNAAVSGPMMTARMVMAINISGSVRPRSSRFSCTADPPAYTVAE